MDRKVRASRVPLVIEDAAPWIFGACLLLHFATSLVGWDRPLVGHHIFRQTQTALSTYVMVQDGLKLDYETPVLGKPWAIPLEFPLFQWVVASACRLLGSPLDQTGKTFSLLFFYACLPLLFLLLGHLVRERWEKYLLLCFVLLTPNYLHWPKTFLIESLALLLSLLYLYATLRARDRDAPWAPWLAAFFGALAGMVKLTTWVAFLLPCALGFLRPRGSHPPAPWRERVPEALRLGGLLFLLPLLATSAWTYHAAQVRALNPMAQDFFAIEGFTDWNFGTPSQKVSLGTWTRILFNTHLLSLPSLPEGAKAGGILALLLLAGAATYRSLPLRTAQASCLAAFLLAPLVFTNLYAVHDYYQFANGVFLSLFLGLAFLALWQRPWRGAWKALPPIGTLVFLGALYGSYLLHFQPFREPGTAISSVSEMVRTRTQPEDVILYYGMSWNPSIPYYAQRRALMDPLELPLDDPRMKAALEALGKDPIQAMLITGWRSQEFLRERIERFGLAFDPFYDAGCFLFVRRGRWPASPVGKN